MKKQLVFMHQTYPAQFGPITQFLLREYDVDIAFFSEHISKPISPGIKHYQYKPARTGHEDNPYFFSRYFERETASMHGLYNALKSSRIEPDVLVGHAAFGTMGLLHVQYPDIPRIGFFELFYDPYNRHSESRPEYPAPKPNRLRIPLRNATQLVELEYCTKGYCPTPFQKSTYPAAYQHKLSVIFDGIDTDFYKPGEVSPNSELKRTWPADAKLVTYVSRGLEAMRGFDTFMEVAHRVSQKRDDVHFVVAGNPKTNYGSEMISVKEPTFKDHVLKQHPYDLNRFHFLDRISERALVDLFRLSDCHFYWTVPFTLSWSLLQAMSTGCLVVASDTAPVRDAIESDANGLLVQPHATEETTGLLLNVLDNGARYTNLRVAARETALRDYSVQVRLPILAEFLHDVAGAKSGRFVDLHDQIVLKPDDGWRRTGEGHINPVRCERD
jgi:glycosyltransferase involved in cell wall biosynthesis